MKSITLSYVTNKTVTLDYKKLAPKDKKFVQAWLKDDEDRTPLDWDLVQRNSLSNLIKKYIGDDVYWWDIDVKSID